MLFSPLNQQENNLVRTIKEIKLPSKKALVECTNTIYNKVNTRFEKQFGVTFAEGLTFNKEMRLQEKPSQYENKKKKRDITRTIKKDLQQILNDTAVNRYKYVLKQ